MSSTVRLFRPDTTSSTGHVSFLIAGPLTNPLYHRICVDVCLSLHGQILGVSKQRKGYLTVSGAGMGGGLGNNLFQLLTSIGVADRLGRLPYVKMSNEGTLNRLGYRIRELFPRLEQQFRIVYWNIFEKGIQFSAGHCCVYDNPARLMNMTDEYLIIQGSYFQSFKYFDHLRENVRQWLLPNETFLQQAEAKVPPSFLDRFMICMHIRRGDFATDGHHEPSNASFSSIALNYLMEKYQLPMRKVAGIVMGNDPKWERESFGNISDIFVMETTADQDIAFTRKHCEVVLLTAPSSTFGFFLGYLSKNFVVYYRDILQTGDHVQNEMKPEDFFLPEWIKIREKGGKIEELSS